MWFHPHQEGVREVPPRWFGRIERTVPQPPPSRGALYPSQSPEGLHSRGTGRRMGGGPSIVPPMCTSSFQGRVRDRSTVPRRGTEFRLPPKGGPVPKGSHPDETPRCLLEGGEGSHSRRSNVRTDTQGSTVDLTHSYLSLVPTQSDI